MTLGALGAWLALLPLAPAAEPPPEDTWRVWFESKAMHLPVETAIPESHRTVWAAGFLGEDGLTPFSKDEYAAHRRMPPPISKRSSLNTCGIGIR